MSRIIKQIPGILERTVNSYDPNLAKIILPWALRHPRYLRTFIRLRKIFKKSEQTRIKNRQAGVQVPPFMILSITSKCNLRCSGCYAEAAGNISSNDRAQLTLEQWHNIITEASELGVFCFIIAGGEPFLFPDLLDLCLEHKNNFFLILTNGTNIKADKIKALKKLSNVGIIVSLEGGSELTDARRGSGVYKKAIETLRRLIELGVVTGICVTLTRINQNYWLEPRHIDELIKLGIRIGVFIEYIPISPNNNHYNDNNNDNSNPNCLKNLFASCGLTERQILQIYNSVENNDHSLILIPEERSRFREYMLNCRKTKSIYIVHSPGDEEYFGGCVSAGRGFAHVTSRGDLTPCPVSNIATHNLIKDSLRDGLASPLFKKICEDEHLLETDGFPCALFAHPKEVDELAQAVGAYRTNIR
jgi:MoaA/NifB/PqqE/SkfB family radical SAM enzyme